MKGEIGVFVLKMVECMASSPETLRIPAWIQSSAKMLLTKTLRGQPPKNVPDMTTFHYSIDTGETQHTA